MKNILYTLALLVCFSSFGQCYLSSRSNSFSPKQLKGTSLSSINTSLSNVKNDLEKMFDIVFELKYYSGEIAYASPNCKTFKCDGTVGLGISFLKKLYDIDEELGYWMIISVLSHEAAHIFQYKNKIKFENTVQQEISADFIAGWYMGKLMKDYEGEYDFSGGASKAYNEMEDRRQSISEWKQSLRIFFGYLGDNNYTDINHHGNYATRSMAIHKGMRSYTGWAQPINSIDGRPRDYKRRLALYAQRDAAYMISQWNKP